MYKHAGFFSPSVILVNGNQKRDLLDSQIISCDSGELRGHGALSAPDGKKV